MEIILTEAEFKKHLYQYVVRVEKGETIRLLRPGGGSVLVMPITASERTAPVKRVGAKPVKTGPNPDANRSPDKLGHAQARQTPVQS